MMIFLMLAGGAAGCLGLLVYVQSSSKKVVDRRSVAPKPQDPRAKKVRDPNYGTDNLKTVHRRAKPAFGRRSNAA